MSEIDKKPIFIKDNFVPSAGGPDANYRPSAPGTTSSGDKPPAPPPPKKTD